MRKRCINDMKVLLFGMKIGLFRLFKVFNYK